MGKNKVLSVILSLAMVFSLCSGVAGIISPVKVKAADAVITDYTDYSFGSKIEAEFVEKGAEKYFYKFTLQESGTIEITGAAYTPFFLRFYDEAANQVCGDNSYSPTSGNDSGEAVGLTYMLNSGTYYVGVERYASRYGKLYFTMTYKSAGESFKEVNGGSNNAMATASEAEPGKTYTGLIAHNDLVDLYKIELASDTCLSFKITSPMEVIEAYVMDSNGNEIWDDTVSMNSNISEIVFEKRIPLEKGTYYVGLKRYASRDFGVYNVCISNWKPAKINISSSKGDKKCLKLNWKSISEISGYKVRYSTKKNMKKAKTVDITGESSTGTTIDKLSSKKNYYVQVCAYIEKDGVTVYGAWSKAKKVKTK